MERPKATSASELNSQSPNTSLAARSAAFAVRIYQLFLSPVKYFIFGPSGGCRFHPTCSCYARSAYLKRGFWMGTWLTFTRIIRCHPFNKGGYDPLPDLKPAQSKPISRGFKKTIDG